jgi:hypothetical protein
MSDVQAQSSGHTPQNEKTGPIFHSIGRKPGKDALFNR